MKRFIFTTILITAFLSSGFSNGGLSIKSNNSKSKLNFKGTVSGKDKNLRAYTIKVYDNNKLVKTVNSGYKSKFNVKLPSNSYCTIEVSKPGYFTRKIAVSTTNSTNEKVPSFNFELSLFSNEELKGIDTQILDFPAAMISYDVKKEKFVHDRKYHMQLKREYNLLLQKVRENKVK